jgi:hypothetical protein
MTRAHRDGRHADLARDERFAVNTQPQDGVPGGDPSPPPRRTSMLVWFAALLAAAGLVWAVLVLSGVSDTGDSLITVAWVLILLSFGFNTWMRKKQRNRYRRRFPSLDALRHHVDADALREVRDKHGQTQAVKRLRQQLPEVPLADAVKLIKSL